MTPEQSAAYVMSQTVCAMAEIAGMQAENQIRTIQSARTGAFVKLFNQQDFQDVILRYGIGQNDVIGNFYHR